MQSNAIPFVQNVSCHCIFHSFVLYSHDAQLSAMLVFLWSFKVRVLNQTLAGSYFTGLDDLI